MDLYEEIQLSWSHTAELAWNLSWMSARFWIFYRYEFSRIPVLSPSLTLRMYDCSKFQEKRGLFNTMFANIKCSWYLKKEKGGLISWACTRNLNKGCKFWLLWKMEVKEWSVCSWFGWKKGMLAKVYLKCKKGVLFRAKLYPVLCKIGIKIS